MEPLSSISAALNSSPPLPRLLVGVRWILISPRARTQTAPSHRRGKLIYKQQRPLAHLTVICTQRILTLLSNSEKKKTTKLIRCLAGSLDSTCLRSCAAVKLSLLTWISVTLMSPLSFSLCGYRLKISSLMAPLLLTPLLLTGAKSFLISATFKQQNRSVHSRCVQILFLCMRHLRGSRSARAVCVRMENWREEN